MTKRLKSFLFICLLLAVFYQFDVRSCQFTESDLETMATTHSRYCGRKPDCNESVYYQRILHTSNPSAVICCEGCSCNLSSCVNNDNIGMSNCCPELLNQTGEMFEKSSCIHPQLKPWSPENKNQLQSAVIMRDRCHHSYNAEEIKDKCEQRASYTDFDTKTPVSILWPGHVDTYVNRYCVYCNYFNNDSHLLYWIPKIDCYKWTFDITLTSFEQIVEEVQKSEYCSLYFIPPENIDSSFMKSCTAMISECNVTGLWRQFDAMVSMACSAYFSPFQNIYRNIFCYICNSGDDIETTTICKLADNTAVSFSLVLKFFPEGIEGLEQETNNLECNNGSIHDLLQGKCLEIRCLMTQLYMDGDCQPVVEEIGGMIFNVFLKITPYEPFVYSNDMKYAVERYFKSWLDYTAGWQHYTRNLQILFHRSSNVSPSDDIMIDVFWVNFLLDLKPSYYKHDMATFSTVREFVKLHKSNVTVHISLSKQFVSTLKFDTGVSNSTEDVPILLPVLFCPVVELNTSFYNMIYNTIGVYIKQLDSEIERGEYMRTNSSLVICKHTFEFLIETYIHKQNQIRNRMKSQLDYSPEGILSLVCSSFSITCSALTLVVYARIKSMRTQPGVNNISLVLSLVCAQTFFQFGIGQSDNIPKYMCSLIGGLIHYFWLVTILWMNVCSFHMFRIFYSLRNVDYYSKILRTTCFYWVYCLLAALVPPFINIIVSYTTRETIGYGGNVCYISEYEMVGYCFSLPVALIIVTNLLMFAITIQRISSKPAVNSERREEKKYLIIYAKLSTLTGVTWIFGFLYLFTNISVFEYIFIILNAGQGVFLFLSFACNARVLRLLRKHDGNSSNFIQRS